MNGILNLELIQPDSELKDCEETIARGLDTFTEVAAALVKIRDMKLYLQTHSTFQKYCSDRWRMSARRTYQLIAAKDVSDRISIEGLPPPQNEAVARALAVVPRDEQVKIWSAAISYFNGRVTAASLRKFLPCAKDLGELTHSGYSACCPKCSHVFTPIFVEKASRGPKTPSRAVRWACEKLKGESAVDFGCGRFRNTGLIQANFRRVIAVDTAEQVKRIREASPNGVDLINDGDFERSIDCVDVIFLIAVLHIVPLDERKRIAALVAGRSRYIVVEVPGHDAHYRRTGATPYSDGHVMRGNTFYAMLNKGDIMSLFPNLVEVISLPDKSATILILANKCSHRIDAISLPIHTNRSVDAP